METSEGPSIREELESLLVQTVQGAAPHVMKEAHANGAIITPVGPVLMPPVPGQNARTDRITESLFQGWNNLTEQAKQIHINLYCSQNNDPRCHLEQGYYSFRDMAPQMPPPPGTAPYDGDQGVIYQGTAPARQQGWNTADTNAQGQVQTLDRVETPMNEQDWRDFIMNARSLEEIDEKIKSQGLTISTGKYPVLLDRNGNTLLTIDGILDMGNSEMVLDYPELTHPEIGQQGYGSVYYILIARKFKKQGRRLISDNMLEPGAEALWQSFVRIGIATKEGDKYKILNDTI